MEGELGAYSLACTEVEQTRAFYPEYLWPRLQQALRWQRPGDPTSQAQIEQLYAVMMDRMEQAYKQTWEQAREHEDDLSEQLEILRAFVGRWHSVREMPEQWQELMAEPGLEQQALRARCQQTLQLFQRRLEGVQLEPHPRLFAFLDQLQARLETQLQELQAHPGGWEQSEAALDALLETALDEGTLRERWARYLEEPQEH